MTDVVMPEMNGRELAGNLLSHYPDLKRLFMSGYTANVIAHHGVLDEGMHFIQKPFSKKDLRGEVAGSSGRLTCSLCNWFAVDYRVNSDWQFRYFHCEPSAAEFLSSPISNFPCPLKR